MDKEVTSKCMNRFHEENIVPLLVGLKGSDFQVIMNFIGHDFEKNIDEFLRNCDDYLFEGSSNVIIKQSDYEIDEKGYKLTGVESGINDALNLLVNSQPFRRLFEKEKLVLLLVEENACICFMKPHVSSSDNDIIYDVRKFIKHMVSKAKQCRDDYLKAIPAQQTKTLDQLGEEMDKLKQEYETLKQECDVLKQEKAQIFKEVYEALKQERIVLKRQLEDAEQDELRRQIKKDAANPYAAWFFMTISGFFAYSLQKHLYG